MLEYFITSLSYQFAIRTKEVKRVGVITIMITTTTTMATVHNVRAPNPGGGHVPASGTLKASHRGN